ncbi:MAG TPA: sulfotransferase [Vicinamibacterales bacterium]|nr:sulfotransferase [Vicinamibacterales bacterium]
MVNEDRYVLIVGSPRSGTSLLRRVLSQSGAVCGHPLEPQYILDLHERFGFTITDVAGALDELVSHRMFPAELINATILRNRLGGRTSMDLSEFLAVCYRVMRGDSDQTVLLKHPTLVLHPDVMQRLFPKLRIIQCVRDPRANILSRRTRWPATNVWTAATRWSESIHAGRRFHTDSGTPYIETRYEDLLMSPERTCRTLCDFLEIPFEPAMLVVDYAMDEFDPGKPGVSDKHHFRSFEAQRIDKWRQFLEPAEVKLIETRCREGMELFGYAPTAPRVNPLEYYGYYLPERGRALVKATRRTLRRYRMRSAWRSFASSV